MYGKYLVVPFICRIFVISKQEKYECNDNIKLKVNWFSERADNNDDNNGYHHGIYTFKCTLDEFDPEAGYGSYDVLNVEWYKTESERDLNF